MKRVVGLIGRGVLISDRWIFLCHYFFKLFEVYPVVLVLISVFDHLLNLGPRKSFPNALANFLEFVRPERAHAVFVKNFEQLLKIRLTLVVPAEAKDLEKSLEIHLYIRRLSGHDL
jgi:hypothetical protein